MYLFKSYGEYESYPYLLHLWGARIYQSLISIKREDMAAGLSLRLSMYIYMNTLNSDLLPNFFEFLFQFVNAVRHGNDGAVAVDEE